MQMHHKSLVFFYHVQQLNDNSWGLTERLDEWAGDAVSQSASPNPTSTFFFSALLNFTFLLNYVYATFPILRRRIGTRDAGAS